MKKYTLVLFILSFILLGFNVNSASAYDSGCIGTALYSITTGQFCGSSQGNYFNSSNDYGCTSVGPYNTITGQPCYSGSQVNYFNSSNDYGCSPGAQYNTITGQPCYGAQYQNQYQYPYQYQNQYPYQNQYQYPYQYQNQYPYQSPYQYPYQNSSVDEYSNVPIIFSSTSGYYNPVVNPNIYGAGLGGCVSYACPNYPHQMYR